MVQIQKETIKPQILSESSKPMLTQEMKINEGTKQQGQNAMAVLQLLEIRLLLLQRVAKKKSHCLAAADLSCNRESLLGKE